LDKKPRTAHNVRARPHSLDQAKQVRKASTRHRACTPRKIPSCANQSDEDQTRTYSYYQSRSNLKHVWFRLLSSLGASLLDKYCIKQDAELSYSPKAHQAGGQRENSTAKIART